MCRIYVNFHTTLRKVGSVLTGDYCRLLQYFRKSTGKVQDNCWRKKSTNHIFLNQ